VLKIPVLIEHFHEHNQKDENLSFWSFIKMHYSGKIVTDEDYQRDQQLPLRNADCCQMAINNVCECHHVAIEIITPKENPRQFSLYKEGNKPQFTAFDIFQPPRSNC
jgi:hypothetical protein